MKLTRRASRTLLAATITLGVVAVPAAAITTSTLGGASAQAPAAVPAGTQAPAGSIVLTTTSAGGTVVWEDLRQDFTGGQQCAISTVPGSDDILAITGSVGGDPGTAGFRNGQIGVFEFDGKSDGPANASQCFRVDAGSFTKTETLGLALGAGATDEFGPVVATGARVTLAAQSKAGRLTATLVKADGSEVSSRTITWKGRQMGAVISTPAFSGEFSGIRLTATEGSFSLRGATLDVVSQAKTIECLETATVAGGLNVPGVTVTRLDNADGSDCVAVRYTLTNGEQIAQLLKPLDEELAAQFILDFVWTVSPANTGDVGAALLPETTIDYEQGGGEIPLRWCPDITTVDGYPVIASVLTNPAVVDQDGLAGTQYTCIISQNSRVFDGSPDYVTVEQRVYLLGDAAYRFR